MDIVERLIELCTDYDGRPMVDEEPPLDNVRVGDLREAAAEITRLRTDTRNLIRSFEFLIENTPSLS